MCDLCIRMCADAKDEYDAAARCMVAIGYISWPDDGHDVKAQTSDVRLTLPAPSPAHDTAFGVPPPPPHCMTRLRV